jgi:predicted ATPase/DNA-binding CsgD family transcriptional regulator
VSAADGGVHGFPAALTSFVGRAGAVREVAGLLEEYRLVTITGPGGVGKTRLAGEVARDVAGRFADGAWLAELAPVADPALVPAVVAAALRVPDQPGVPVSDVLARVLSRQQLLLVLDNCEHVIGAAAGLCAGLLAACDDVRVLATSREPLAVAGEARYRLGPLSLPDADDAAGAGGSDAAALFADRARRADAHFDVDRESGPLVARIVARLDGMPLAIELAAARVEALGVSQLLDRLGDRFAVLAGGDRLAPGRHRSLAATVEWSYQLLDDQQRRVFRLVSAFPGPFTLEAAEVMAGPGAGPAVLHLVDCSLLSPPRPGPDDRARYQMLETLRAYAARLRADAGEQDRADAVLAGYALRLAEQASAGQQTTAGEVAAAHWLDAEDATMRQVQAWAIEHDAALALRLAGALGWWWFLRGRLAGEYPVLRQAAELAGAGSGGWCAAQFWLGWTALSVPDLEGALGYFTALRDAAADWPPSRELCDALAGRSTALRNMGRLAEAAADARQALVLARQAGYPAGEVMALGELGLVASYLDDHHHAVRLARQAEQITAGVPGWMARVSNYALTAVLIAAGDLAGAERACAAGQARCRDVGDLRGEAGLLPMAALLDVQAGRLEDAAVHLRDGLQLALRIGNRGELINSLDGCGHLCAAAGRHAEAVTVWAALGTLLRHRGLTEWPADAYRRQEPLHQAEQALGPARAQAATERGAAMSLDTAAEYAVMLTGPGPRPSETAHHPVNLSARERELVTLVAQGRTDAQIAAQLYISIRTVRSHLDRIRDKTGCRRRADLTRLALAAGLA